jgi:hypothetical protein
MKSNWLKSVSPITLVNFTACICIALCIHNNETTFVGSSIQELHSGNGTFADAIKHVVKCNFS